MRRILAWRSIPKSGEQVNGDRVLHRVDGHRELLVILDGLGHGQDAARVGAAAERFLPELPLREGAVRVARGLHDALRDTRGCAALICLFDGDVIDGCSIGNVELRSSGAPIPVVASPGILGVSVRRFRGFDARLTAGTRLVAFTDGLPTTTSFSSLRGLSPDRLCQELLDRHRRAHDDATVLVADVVE